MVRIELEEAGKRFMEMIDQIKSGEEIHIVDQGETVALLISPTQNLDDKRETFFRKLEDLRKSNPPISLEELLQWRKEGQK